jgi:hypothetical protein
MTEHRTTWCRRRALYGLLVVALVALAIPISYAVAGSNPSRVTVPVQKYDGSCDGYVAGRTAIGKATFERMKSGEVRVTYTLNGGLPSTTYFWGIESDSPDSCAFISRGGCCYFKNKTGPGGQFRETVVVPEAVGRNDFWIYSVNDAATEYYRSAVARV